MEGAQNKLFAFHFLHPEFHVLQFLHELYVKFFNLVIYDGPPNIDFALTVVIELVCMPFILKHVFVPKGVIVEAIIELVYFVLYRANHALDAFIDVRVCACKIANKITEAEVPGNRMHGFEQKLADHRHFMYGGSLKNYFFDFNIELQGLFISFIHVNDVISAGSVYCVCIEFVHVDGHFWQMKIQTTSCMNL